MRKIFLIILFFVSCYGFSQGGPKVDVVKFRGEVTTTVRNTFDVPTGETWLIKNVTTGNLEWAASDDVWQTLLVSSQIDTYSELNTLVADETLSKASDIGVTIQAYNANTDTDSTDDLTNSDLIDDDTFATATSSNIPSSESVKAYVDANSGSGISDIVEDTTPQLGGPLDNNDFAISMNQPGASTIFNWTNSTNAETMAIGFTSDALGFSFVGSSTAGGLFLDYSDDRWEIGTDPILTGGDLIDDDTFATATSSNIPSAESVKAYVDASGGGGLSSTDIDTYGELNTLVADVTLTHNGLFDTFAELNTIVADATLVDTNNAQTLTNKTINADNNAISNIGSAEITNQSITSADIQDEAIGAALIATNAVSTNKIDDMAVTNAKVMDNTVLEPKLNITNAPTDNHILSYNAAGTNFTWIPPSFEVADIGAADKTLTSSDVHKFNYTDDTVIFTLDNSLSVGDELTFAVTDIDSIITVVPDTGVDIIGNGTGPIDGAFQIDSLNIGKVKKLASNLYYAMGYIKPYSPSVSLIVPTLDDINTKLYIDGREFAASSNGASVSPTDQSGNSTPLTSIDITKQTDSDSDPTFSFNGTSSRISLGNNFNFTAGVAQSIGIFISADGFGTGTRFSKRDDATGGSNDHFAIYNGYYYMGNNEGNPSFSSTTNVLITLTKTTGDVWYIYENGTQRATGAWTNETSAVDLLIGAQVNGGGFSDYATGEIEVFFITDDFITNTEAGTIATEINTR